MTMQQAEPVSHYYDSQRLKLHYVDWGNPDAPPLLMIHGEYDNYIKPPMARALFDKARAPKEFWLVPGAKHNQALQVAGEEYRRRVLDFFERHLAEEATGRPSAVMAAAHEQAVS